MTGAQKHCPLLQKRSCQVLWVIVISSYYSSSTIGVPAYECANVIAHAGQCSDRSSCPEGDSGSELWVVTHNVTLSTWHWVN